jgi:hypothetical protein
MVKMRLLCSMCYILLLNNFNVCFTDRGGLKYHSITLANRMWNIYMYFRIVFPQIRTLSKIVDELVEFIVPRLSKCKELQCSDDGIHCNIICSFLCKNFFLLYCVFKKINSVCNLSENLLYKTNHRKERLLNFRNKQSVKKYQKICIDLLVFDK